LLIANNVESGGHDEATRFIHNVTSIISLRNGGFRGINLR
jgi:hypothetical protein